MKKLAFAWIAMLLLLVGCSKEDGGSGSEPSTPQGPTPTESKIQIADSDKTINFTKDAGERSISFTASESWTATLINNRADEWCSVSPTSGQSGSASIKIAVTNNDTPDERSASVQLKSGTATVTIVVTQKQQDALTVTQSRFDVGAEGGDITIVVAANVSVEYSIASAASSWIHSAQGANTRAMTTSQFKFTIDPNTASEKREGAITVYGNGLSETIMVYQAKGDGSSDNEGDGDNDNKGGNTDPDDPDNPGGGEESEQPETPSIVVSTNQVTLSSAEQSFAVEVSHDVDVSYEISAEGQSWLSHVDTRAMSTNTYYFNVTENDDVTERSATITFTNPENGLAETVRVSQEGVNSSELIFPDPVFRKYVLDSFDKNRDGQISQEEADLVTRIYVTGPYYTSRGQIKSLKGIEYFTNLETLYCDNNYLTELDVSQNIKLTELCCHTNPLELLNLGDTNIISLPRSLYDKLFVSTTKFKIISSKITELDVRLHGLYSLDVSECPALIILNCESNPLEFLNLGDVNPAKYNSYTSQSHGYYDHLHFRDLRSSKLKIISNKISHISINGSFPLSPLQSLDVSECPALTQLECTSLRDLTNLDISGCVALTDLDCTYNQLTSLDVSKNMALTSLDCANNQLTSLDVSNNTALTSLWCYSNPIELLNLGDLEDKLYSCSFTSTKLKIISRKIEQLYITQNKNLQSLDVSECPVLTNLVCTENQLTNLNVSGCTTLTSLWCFSNQLTNLDLSDCYSLKDLWCYSNQLTTLDLSKTNMNKGRLRCAPMDTLQTLILKTGWGIADYKIPDKTEIVYVD